MRGELWGQPQAWVQPSGLFRMEMTPRTSNPACDQCPPFTPSRALGASSSCSSSLPKPSFLLFWALHVFSIAFYSCFLFCSPPSFPLSSPWNSSRAADISECSTEPPIPSLKRFSFSPPHFSSWQSNFLSFFVCWKGDGMVWAGRALGGHWCSPAALGRDNPARQR